MSVIRKTLPFWILISFLLVKGLAKAQDWHKPTPCFGCHGGNLDAYYGSGEWGGCHFYGLDVSKLQEEHNPKICKVCHIGSTIVNGTDKEVFHSGHQAVQCTQCHTEDNFTVIKIESKGFECVSCHGNQVHEIHAKNLNKACPYVTAPGQEAKLMKERVIHPINPRKPNSKSS